MPMVLLKTNEDDKWCLVGNHVIDGKNLLVAFSVTMPDGNGRDLVFHPAGVPMQDWKAWLNLLSRGIGGAVLAAPFGWFPAIFGVAAGIWSYFAGQNTPSEGYFDAATGNLIDERPIYTTDALRFKKMNQNLDGLWYFEGDRNTPCAIFQQGPILLLVNERGDVATGKAVADANVVVMNSPDGHWLVGLKATVLENGQALSWANGIVWKKEEPSKEVDQENGTP